MEPFIGQIMLVGFNFVPRGWASCNGQLLSIAQNSALFSLLGTTYGGNGQTTFGLPDLRGRAPVHFGQGPGLSSYTQGEIGGTESVTLTMNNLPPHAHSINGPAAEQTTDRPSGTVAPAIGGSYGVPSESVGMTGVAGNGQQVENRPPYLVLNYVIALEGIFPSRE